MSTFTRSNRHVQNSEKQAEKQGQRVRGESGDVAKGSCALGAEAGGAERPVGPTYGSRAAAAARPQCVRDAQPGDEAEGNRRGAASLAGDGQPGDFGGGNLAGPDDAG